MTIFKDLPSPFEATRYHSLIVKRETLPSCLEISAETAEGEIMGLRHRTLAVEGVQFHPESILTRPGKDRSEEHTSELQSLAYLVCRLLLEKKKQKQDKRTVHDVVTSTSSA